MLTTVAQQLYLAYFGRPADPRGLENFAGVLAGFLPENASIRDLRTAYDTSVEARNLVNSFSASRESQDLYQGSTEEFVEAIFLNIFGRPPQEPGRVFWIDAIDNRGLDPAKAALEIIDAAIRNGERDSRTVQRKTEVTQEFTNALDTPEKVAAFSGNAAAQAAREMLSKVNAETDLQSFIPQITALVAGLTNVNDSDGGSLGTATLIDFGTETSSAFNNKQGSGQDVDVFSFEVQSGSFFEVVLTTEANTSYRLLDSNGKILSQGSNLSPLENQQIFNIATNQSGSVFLELASATPGNTGYTFSVNESLAPPPASGDELNIDFVYLDGTEEFASFFDQVEDFLQQVIIEGLPEATLQNGQRVDDVQIEVSQRFVDGQFNVLAFAGPQELRPSAQGFLPSAGILVLDSSDTSLLIEDGSFFDVLVHEVLHVLGAGTLWDFLGLTSNGQYTGQNVLDEYRALTGNPNEQFVPLNDISDHFSEEVFGNEIMTPFTQTNENTFSRLTIAAFEDLGYSVNYAAAEPFVLPVGVDTFEA